MNNKIVSILSYVLMGISVLFAVLFYTGTISEEPIIMWCYGLAIIAAAAAVVFPVLHLLKDPKDAKVVFLGIVSLIVVTGISYAISGDEVLPSYAAYNTTSFASKLVSTGLILFYLLAAGAIIAAIYSEVSKIFK